jgi:hypothetical protein
MQVPCGSTAPAIMGEHAPALPATLQAWQLGQLAEPQHTPSTQLPLAHWPPAVQAAPFVFFMTQLPPTPVQ